MEQKREVETREGYRERVNERAGKREEMESEKNLNNMKRETLTDHPIGEGLG
jgi:uncharacterized protein YaiL (DUF2058 family)